MLNILFLITSQGQDRFIKVSELKVPAVVKANLIEMFGILFR